MPEIPERDAAVRDAYDSATGDLWRHRASDAQTDRDELRTELGEAIAERNEQRQRAEQRDAEWRADRDAYSEDARIQRGRAIREREHAERAEGQLREWQRVYLDASDAMNDVLGTEATDGAGQGLVADVRLVVERCKRAEAERDEAREALERHKETFRELTTDGVSLAEWHVRHRAAAELVDESGPPGSEGRDFSVIARFTVKGEPVSKARARFTSSSSKTRAYTPAKTKTAEELVGWKFRAAAPKHTIDPNAAYGVIALFFLPAKQRRDVDNMLKLVLDGMNGVAWADDDQVVEVRARKILLCDVPEPARTEVLVYRIDSMPAARTDTKGRK